MHLSFPVFILVAALAGSTEILAAQVVTSERAQARRLLLEASRLIDEVPESQRSSAVANIASQLSRSGDLEDALRISQSQKNPGDQDSATGLIAWNLVQQGNVGQALRLVESISNEQNREGQYAPLAALLAEKGDLTGALRIVQISRDPQRRVSILVQIAQQKARSKKRDVAGATEVLHHAMESAEELVHENASNANLLSEITTTQSEIGDATGALRTLSELSAIAHQYAGPEGNGLLLHLLGCAQAQVGDLVGALQTHEEMVLRSNSASNSDIVLMTIAEEQAKQGLVADALQSAERISDNNLRSATLREVAIARGTNRTLQDAIEAIHRIPNSASRSEAIGALALEQAEADNPAAALTAERALEFENEAGSGSVSSDRGREMIAVTRAILGDFAEAEEIIKSMPEPESRVWPLWNLTSMLTEAGRETEALTLAEDENAPLPKLHALLGTAQGLLTRVASKERTSASK
jgi:tetratricopeptide (TPR) repeat protein